MILWAIHSVEFWEKLKEKRILHGDGRRIWHCFCEPYRWMIRQMKTRLPVSPPGCNYPLWAWYQYNGIKYKRPDLRSAGHIQRGTRGVRIEFEIEDSEVLLSDFIDWHCVLNGCCCSKDEEDMDEFDKELERDGFSGIPLKKRRFH